MFEFFVFRPGRKLMRKLNGMIVALGVLVSVSAAAQKPSEQTWTGKISDSIAGEASWRRGTRAKDDRCRLHQGVRRRRAREIFVSEGRSISCQSAFKNIASLPARKCN
jgi:hypothetical protein